MTAMTDAARTTPVKILIDESRLRIVIQRLEEECDSCDHCGKCELSRILRAAAGWQV
jgi:hypothetical protein